ncbi:TIGR04282 family arsenosugar biosynthesis glycosyltransferase [Neptuniibacter sp. PT34_22]|uniref:TIGR04282 family arsenosugar biosynthesis glycosyltransferase n=1 Tax=Neptuniibacter sp. PT34_22 TaxID=3398205 RepID=UPI0039F56608
MSKAFTLLIFCKQPRIGQGKQRIAASLGAETTFEIAKALLQCALEDAQAWAGRVVLSPASVDEVEWAEGLLDGEHVQVVPQPSGNLGERINTVDQRLREQGHQNIVTIGTDAPILNLDLLQQVCHKMADYDVVCSKADDGGVTVMASGVAWPDLEALPWSTERLAQGLEEFCLDAGLSVGYIEPTYDIDLEADLVRLIEHLKSDRRPARKALLQLITPIVNNRMVTS